MEHTQGKWIVDDSGQLTGQGTVIRKNGIRICRMIDQMTTKPETRVANAKLIAAAPLMYDALQGDEANGIPNAQLVLVQAMLGDFEAVKVMLKEMCSIHAAAIFAAKGK